MIIITITFSEYVVENFFNRGRVCSRRYLSPMIDCFDGMVVSWSIGTSPDAELVNTMLDAAIETVTESDEKPIVHSDRGGRYRWPGWLAWVRTDKIGINSLSAVNAAGNQLGAWECNLTIPTHCGMPPLRANVEGLKGHSFLVNTFGLETSSSVDERKWRVWLIHCLVKAARHYNSARNTILMQLDEAKRSPEEMQRGRSLPILDFAEYMEDSVSSIFRAAMCARQLAPEVPAFSLFCEANSDAIDKLLKLRNQHDHMHTQIASGQVGNGPVVLSLDDDGDTLRFRNCRLPLVMMHSLIQGLYEALVALYPQFDVNSTPQPQGTLGISMTMSASWIDASGNEEKIF